MLELQVKSFYSKTGSSEQAKRLMTFRIIFGNLMLILSFHFTQLMIREGNLIYLDCKVTHGLHIQRLWMELSVFLVYFLEGETLTYRT